MMHEPIQAKGPTMSETLMEQYRLRKQRKRRNACIAAIVTVVLVLAVAGGVWWTAGDGSALVRNMFKPKATPATQPVVDSTAAFAYRTAPEFLAMETGDRDTGNVNYSPASMWMALAIAAQGADGKTRSQLNSLLESGSLADSDYQSLLSSINGRYSGAKSEMSAANSLWIDNGYSLASDYQSTVKQTFEAEVTALPFGNQAGAKAMSFTKVGADFASAPVDNVEFTVDRPFLYSYVTPDGIPLFIGAVRNLGGVGGEN